MADNNMKNCLPHAMMTQPPLMSYPSQRMQCNESSSSSELINDYPKENLISIVVANANAQQTAPHPEHQPATTTRWRSSSSSSNTVSPTKHSMMPAATSMMDIDQSKH